MRIRNTNTQIKFKPFVNEGYDLTAHKMRETQFKINQKLLLALRKTNQTGDTRCFTTSSSCEFNKKTHLDTSQLSTIFVNKNSIKQLKVNISNNSSSSNMFQNLSYMWYISGGLLSSIFIIPYYDLLSSILIIPYADVNTLVLNLSIIPIFKNACFVYNDPINQRNEIRNDLKNKSGVYCWYNNVTGKYYIGSSLNLLNRINRYYQNHYLTTNFALTIIKALLKYGMKNFSLIILEITDKENVLIREQFYLDEFKPEYNILKFARNSQGFKHTKESIEKIKKSKIGGKHSDEVRKRMSITRRGESNNFFGKKHTEETILKLKEIALGRTTSNRKGFVVEVIDTLNNSTKNYSSIREAARDLNTHISTLWRREKQGLTTPFRKRYLIKINRD